MGLIVSAGDQGLVFAKEIDDRWLLQFTGSYSLIIPDRMMARVPCLRIKVSPGFSSVRAENAMIFSHAWGLNAPKCWSVAFNC